MNKKTLDLFDIVLPSKVSGTIMKEEDGLIFINDSLIVSIDADLTGQNFTNYDFKSLKKVFQDNKIGTSKTELYFDKNRLKVEKNKAKKGEPDNIITSEYYISETLPQVFPNLSLSCQEEIELNHLELSKIANINIDLDLYPTLGGVLTYSDEKGIIHFLGTNGYDIIDYRLNNKSIKLQGNWYIPAEYLETIARLTKDERVMLGVAWDDSSLPYLYIEKENMTIFLKLDKGEMPFKTKLVLPKEELGEYINDIDFVKGKDLAKTVKDSLPSSLQKRHGVQLRVSQGKAYLNAAFLQETKLPDLYINYYDYVDYAECCPEFKVLKDENYTVLNSKNMKLITKS